MKYLKIKNSYALGIIFSLIFTFSCKDEDHYEPDPSVTSESSLMSLIKENPELTSFAKIVEGIGYDKILESSESYTVWAPKNEHLANLSFATKEDSLRFVKNHIARFLYNASGNTDKTIYMENTKLIKFQGGNNSYTFGGVRVDDANIVAKNGVLHIIEDQVKYTPNIWEKMEDEGFDLIRDYLYSETVMDFDQFASKVIDYNEEGLPVYDSVFNESNRFWGIYPYAFSSSRMLRERASNYYRGGLYSIQREDSSYTMLLPTNKAWQKAYDERFPYFVNNRTDNPDSVQNYYTQFAIVQDLVFRGKISPETATSLESTRIAVLSNPADLFRNSILENLSNGWVYITDELKFNPWESWYKSIKVEAEDGGLTIYPAATVSSVRTISDNVGDVSNGQYVYNASIRAGITTTFQEFYLPNNLAAEYNIYCVFIPDIRYPDNANSPKMTKVQFQVLQLNRETGEYESIKSGGEVSKGYYIKDEATGLASNIVDKENITNMLVYEKFKFPFAFIEEERIPLKLRVETAVTRPPDLSQYANRMSIDYILLEPVRN